MNQTNKTTVLFVDDNIELCEVMKEHLHLQTDYHMLFAHQGKDALVLLEQNVVDVVVLDNRLPDMKGLDLPKIMNQEYLHIPVIFISDYFKEDAIPLVSINLDCRPDYFLPKPFQAGDLIKCIQGCLKKGGLKRADSIFKSYRKVNKKKTKPQEKREEREKRLVEMLILIKESPHKFTYGMFAERYQRSKRQIEFDIQELRRRGYNIKSAKDKTTGNKGFVWVNE